MERMACRRLIGFNGATAMKPWKRWASWVTATDDGSGFNGATAMKPWKRWSTRRRTRCRLKLQWGHGDEAVEEVDSPCGKVMSLETLQWGHGDEAVEEQYEHGLVSIIGLASMGPRR